MSVKELSGFETGERQKPTPYTQFTQSHNLHAV